MDITWYPSPNFAKREHDISFVILHGTWMDSDEAALDRLCSEEASVSCHYYIDKNGKLFQLVKDEYVAWHAGVSAWGDVVGLNNHSIGIEISNAGEGKGVDYTEEQYKTVIELLKRLQSKYNIKPENVLAHSDIAPERKNDPGEHFSWQKLYDAGVATSFNLGKNPNDDQLYDAGYRASYEMSLAAYKRRF